MVRTILRHSVAVASLVDKMLFLPLLFFADEIVRVLLGERWTNIVPLFYLIAAGNVICGPTMYSSFPILNAVGKSSVISSSMFIVAAMTWSFLPVLTRHFGVLGYGYLTIMFYLLIPYYYYEIRRSIGSVHILPVVLRPLIAIALVLGLGSLLVVHHNKSFGWAIVPFSMLAELVYLVIAYALSPNQFRAIVDFVSHRESPLPEVVVGPTVK